ncbi:tRNA (uridine(54)-C5)-methyltransferase TrmA [Alteromonas sp. ASW11-130]|uniref:tRNA (uridine(54)-C5)-methyltransferase TrmA n=1 Tax=Alteromonas sp. ASW11-130 TaxID=3015775 RepID=UPI002241CAB5|nr:tRNA (uridine(54)-C5)-methyltransferase TrmA [Alteromonas sp. ASW11-130]MCW8092703.1 tRNA (uridine(54)-C5)-methyltransferase TrmA [Alteromonas sp. ASW11-130]
MTNEQLNREYTKQLEAKAARLTKLLSPFDAPNPTIFASSPKHYRMRAEFRVWHEGEDLYHIMFDQETKQKYRVDQLPAACSTINKVMAILIDEVRNIPVLRRKLFQVDYLCGLSEELVISLLYHKQLEDEWEEAARELKQTLSKRFNVNLIGRARKQKVVIDQDFIVETLPVNGKTFFFKHTENSFTQPNAEVNCSMIEWALSVCGDTSADLLELYCGAGNFSLPLAQKFRKVIGTEIAKPSVSAAQYSIERNNIDNVDIVRLSAEEFVEAMNGKREFERLKGIDLSSYDFSTVLVDPPRAGLDPASTSMIQAYDEIVYISCNPETLANNLKQLCQTHFIEACALFDQFPFTHHIEVGVKLKRRAEP